MLRSLGFQPVELMHISLEGFAAKPNGDLTVDPVTLGRGIPMFKGIDTPIGLELVSSTTFDAGSVGLQYRTVMG